MGDWPTRGGYYFKPLPVLMLTCFSWERELTASSDERLRRLALEALVAQSRQVAGWSDYRIARLQAYMQDPSPLVAEAAQFTFIS